MTAIAGDVLLVGSVPLETEAAVFQACSGALGPWLGAVPDGEVGERKFWVTSNVERVAYRGHPDLEVIPGEHLPPGGRSQDEAESLRRLTQVRVRPGIAAVRLTGLRFAEVAVRSYRVLTGLRDAGLVPEGIRFQVSLPTPAAAVMQFFRDPADWPVMLRSYAEAIGEQQRRILQAVPADDLVIQWDVATEVRDLLAGDGLLYPWAPPRSAADKWDVHARGLLELAAGLPGAAGLGYHFCFGTFGGWPHSPAPDAQVCAELARRLIDGSPRRVDYVHIPVMPQADAGFFAPLAPLASLAPVADGDSRIFLGIALNDGLAAFQRRAALAGQFLPDFGIASYCGWGRERPDQLPGLLADLEQCAASRFGRLAPA